MRERLLAQWAEKYKRIENEIKRYEKMQTTLKPLQKELVTDIWLQSISLVIVSIMLLGLAEMIEWIPGVFLYFYVPVLAGLAIFLFGRGMILLIRKIFRLWHHKRKNLPFEYPKPIVVDSNYPAYYPPNYYTEQVCLEWLIEKYHLEMEELKQLRRKIEQASEDDYDALQERLDKIYIYEILGRAR